ncbi:MAG: hypothetical protein ABI769_09580 [Pseudomonadota bacterium]
MVEIREGLTDIAIGTDPLNGQWRDPLSAAHLPTGARVTLTFQLPAALPPRAVVCVRYDFAGNGDEREARGTPRASHTVVCGDRTVYHYRLSYWIPPHAVMTFLPTRARQRTNAPDRPSQDHFQMSIA